MKVMGNGRVLAGEVMHIAYKMTKLIAQKAQPIQRDAARLL